MCVPSFDYSLLSITKLADTNPSSVLFDSATCYIQDPILKKVKETGSPHRDKFSDRAIKCLFLGYPFDKKAYFFMDLDTRKVYSSRDVSFVEHIFPIKHMNLLAPIIPLFNTVENNLEESPLFVNSPDSNIQVSSSDTIPPSNFLHEESNPTNIKIKTKN